jgi:hypothetical protein
VANQMNHHQAEKNTALAVVGEKQQVPAGRRDPGVAIRPRAQSVGRSLLDGQARR